MVNPNIQRNIDIVKDLEYIVVYNGPEQYTYQGIDVADCFIVLYNSITRIEILTTDGSKDIYYNCSYKLRYNNQTSIDRNS